RGEDDVVARDSGRAPGGVLDWLRPNLLPGPQIDTENAIILRSFAGAAPGVRSPVVDERVGIDVQSALDRVLPEFLPVDRVQAVDAVVPGPEDHFAVRHCGRRFGMAARLKVPDLLPGRGIDTEEFAVLVEVVPLAEVQSPVGQNGGAEKFFEILLVVKLPDDRPRLGIEGVETAVLQSAQAVVDVDVYSVRSNARSRRDLPILLRFKYPQWLLIQLEPS